MKKEETNKKQNNALLGRFRKVEHSGIDAFNYCRGEEKKTK